MKSICLIFTVLFLTVLFSCEEDKIDYGLGEYYEEIATVLNDSAYLLDSNISVVNINAYRRGEKSPEAGKRVLLMYSYTNMEIPPYDRAVIVHSVSELSTGELKLVGRKDIDSLRADPLRLESIWLGSRYLNMQFYLNFKSEVHSVGLFTDSIGLHNDTVHIYFKHDSNNDPPGYPVHSFLSFNLGKVLGNPEKKKILSVKVKSDNYVDEIYEFVY